jgi:hypothetical protein
VWIESGVAERNKVFVDLWTEAVIGRAAHSRCRQTAKRVDEAGIGDEAACKPPDVRLGLFHDADERGDAGGEARRRQDALPFHIDTAPFFAGGLCVKPPGKAVISGAGIRLRDGLAAAEGLRLRAGLS